MDLLVRGFILGAVGGATTVVAVPRLGTRYALLVQSTIGLAAGFGVTFAVGVLLTTILSTGFEDNAESILVFSILEAVFVVGTATGIWIADRLQGSIMEVTDHATHR